MRKPVIGDLRVQEVVFPSGRVAYTILHPDGVAHRLAEGFPRTCNGGTDRAYAYLLVDHLRWLEFDSLSPETVTMRDLSRYMAAVGAEYAGPYGRPWRAGKEPYSQSSLDSAAACLKRFYQFQGTQGANLSRPKIGLGRRPASLPGSGSGGVRVLVDQAAQDGFSADLLSVDVGHGGAGSVRFLVGDALGDALVRPGGVAVHLVLGQDGAQMRLAEDQHPVEDLSAQGADKALASCVHPWCPDGAGSWCRWPGRRR